MGTGDGVEENLRGKEGQSFLFGDVNLQEMNSEQDPATEENTYGDYGPNSPLIVIAESIVEMNDALIKTTVPGSGLLCGENHLRLSQTHSQSLNIVNVVSTAIDRKESLSVE